MFVLTIFNAHCSCRAGEELFWWYDYQHLSRLRRTSSPSLDASRESPVSSAAIPVTNASPAVVDAGVAHSSPAVVASGTVPLAAQSSPAVGLAPKAQQKTAKTKPAQQDKQKPKKKVLRPRTPWHLAYPLAPLQVVNVDAYGVPFVPGDAPNPSDMSRSAASTVVAPQPSLSSSTPSVPIALPPSAVGNISSSVSSSSKSDTGNRHKDKRQRGEKRHRSSSHGRRRGKGKKSRRRSPSESSRSSSSSDCSVSSESPKKKKVEKQRSGRKRERPFKPDDDEVDRIFKQLVTNNPFLHSRRGVNQVWKGHLQKLHDDGYASGCTKQKTFTAWATLKCKERYLVRLAESRRNGTGEVMPPSPLDEVMWKWEEKKLGAKTSKNPLHAELLRESCTSTAARLDAMTEKIQKAAAEKYGSGATEHTSHSPTRRNTPTPTSATKLFSPSGRGPGNADARMAFGEAMLSLTRVADGEAQLMQQLLSAMQQPQETHRPQAGLDEQVQHVELLAALQTAGDEYRPLVSFAPAIYAALGIAALSDFPFVSLSDVEAVQLPAMQKRTLLRLARAHSVGTKISD